MRTRGVHEDTLQSSTAISVVESSATLEFLPAAAEKKTALIFICGSGVSARAYAPLLRPIAEHGYAVFVIKLPYRFAPFESHKESAINRARAVIAAHPAVTHWVISGHSLGGALACRVAQTDSARVAGMVLIGTSHPKDADLSSLTIPVTKVYGSNDGVAPPGRVLSNRDLLPRHTEWVEIRGGNHSQFGHYGQQLFDGKATIRREAQQAQARSALLQVLVKASGRDSTSIKSPSLG